MAPKKTNQQKPVFRDATNFASPLPKRVNQLKNVGYHYSPDTSESEIESPKRNIVVKAVVHSVDAPNNVSLSAKKKYQVDKVPNDTQVATIGSYSMPNANKIEKLPQPRPKTKGAHPMALRARHPNITYRN